MTPTSVRGPAPELLLAPALSIVVITYEMRREAPRTLRSLAPPYQQGVGETDYEIVVVDNGSTRPFTAEELAAIAPNIRGFSMPDPGPSPVAAINAGVARSRGRHVGVLIDGARMVTPGVVANALRGLRLHPRAVVATLAWHLGPDHQSRSIPLGYDRHEEDRLLESIGWPADGYRLFEISALAGSNAAGWFGPLAESCALFMSRALFDELGGFDERFDLPGGGTVNLDTFVRACALPDTELVVLLGEGSFHQVHGGVASNATAGVPEAFFAQYAELHGRTFTPPDKTPTYLGTVPPAALRWIEHSARTARAAAP